MKTVFFTEEELLDIDYSYTNFKTKSTPKSNWRILCDTLNILIRAIVKDILSLPKRKKIKNRHLFVYDTSNELFPVIDIQKRMSNSLFINFTNYKEMRIPQSPGIFLSLLYLPHFFALIKQAENKELLRSGKYHFIDGLYRWWNIYLKIKRPKAIILTNDHLQYHRVLRLAAQKNNILTVYIQHASVTRNFPELDFDLALLEGKDAQHKYMKKRNSVDIRLVGMPKFDKYLPYIRKGEKIKSIGVCVNILDESSRIYSFCEKLREDFPDKTIFLRPHPRDVRKEFYDSLSTRYNLVMSDANKDISFEYLKNVDINIAAESSIHLEAALMNVYPVYFRFSNENRDYYGYQNRGLITEAFSSVKELSKFIETIQDKRPSVRNRAKYYVETVNSEFDGKSAELCINAIKSMSYNNPKKRI